MKYILTMLIVTMLATAAHAQYGLGVVTYDITFPSGDLKEFTDNESWRGISIEGRKFFGPQFSAGLSWAWRTFHENTDELITFEGGAASGNQFRRFYVSPILATFQLYMYDPWSNATILPYAGLGVGPYWIEKKLDMGVYTITDSNWLQLRLRAERCRSLRLLGFQDRSHLLALNGNHGSPRIVLFRCRLTGYPAICAQRGVITK
jgi:outer membrane protein